MINGNFVTLDREVNPNFDVSMMYYRKTVKVFGCRQYDCFYRNGRISQCTAALRRALLPIAAQLWIQQFYGGDLIPTYCKQTWNSTLNLSGSSSSTSLNDQAVIKAIQSTVQPTPSPFYDNIFTSHTEDNNVEVTYIVTLPGDLPQPPK